ncbi:hypothetical protein SAMN02982929_03444 [Saccharopolyspora kobensis]|uniref:Uncharacterized protein n=1 Tax=Saccharopolyspora kobensis TaxID=146035 RepID=A0A1H6CQW0_9PSEU|nr:hypothetical protein [Saccharopolyspora kobensis]SEG75382.1 hypothetical protein SAMN02982929_03444 [Saccharopolyspora kobensis]SFC96329.1 hypothetical protein SAMN05216506_10237 [Saccharopolyspora kobensis]
MDESITVERVRHALVVGRLDADGAAVLLAANLPPKRDRTYVVVGASARDAMTRIDPWVAADLADEARGDLCVVAPGFGSMGGNGALPPAKLLADRLGVEVTAPDGEPVALDDGSLFVPGQSCGWVSFRPDGRRTRIGARLPAPWWQDGLPDPAEHLVHVPAGLWLRRPGAEPRDGDRLLTQAPDPDRMYVVLGAPGEPPPASESVVEVLRELPDESRDRAVLACYGFGGGELIREVAGALGAPVRVAHGVPSGDGLVQVDGEGAVRWRPFAVESVYRDDGPPVLDRWLAPGTLAMVEPGSYRLAEGWRADVVPRGLVVRPDAVHLDEAVTAAEPGPTADVVFAAERAVPPEVIAAFDRLVRELPDAARENLRIVPVGDASVLADVEAADRIERVAERPAPSRVTGAPQLVAPPKGAVMVTPDGRILPVAPILAAPARPAAKNDVRSRPADFPDIASVLPPARPASSAPVQQQIQLPEVLQPNPAPPAPPRPPASTWPTPPIPQAAPAPQTVQAPHAPQAAAQAQQAAPAQPAMPGSAQQAPRAVQAPAAHAPLWGHPRSAPAGGQPPWIGQLDTRPAPPAPAEAEPVWPTETQAAAEERKAEAAAQPDAVEDGAAQPESGAVAETEPTEDRAAEPSRSIPATTSSRDFRAVASASAVPPPAPAAAKEAAPVGALPATVASTTKSAAEPATKSITGLLPKRDLPAVQAVEVPEDARSTPEQRRAMRAALGSRYDVATRAVTRLLSERPGMRFASEDRAALLAELAVVRVFADDPTGEYDADFYVCLADGLRRLPTVRTVVVRGIPANTAVRPESVLRLPTPVVAAPATGTEPVGPAEALIWTTTGRRLDGLLDEPTAESEVSHRGDVVLSGHTKLRVLAVESDRILLAEDGTARDAALTRLRAAAAARADIANRPATSRWFGPLPAA